MLEPVYASIKRTLVPVATLALVASTGACKVAERPPITAEWTDTFDRDHLGSDYLATGGSYRILDGALGTQGAHNHPLWLRRKLPRDVRIEFDAWSNTSVGDIKVEVFGDGRSHAKNRGQYASSGYSIVMGGWNNSKSILARGNEHGKEITERRRPKVIPQQRYHWKIVRQGGRIDWFVDDMTNPFLAYDDPAPLAGGGHEYFAFSNWEADTWFDNLKITPL